MGRVVIVVRAVGGVWVWCWDQSLLLLGLFGPGVWDPKWSCSQLTRSYEAYSSFVHLTVSTRCQCRRDLRSTAVPFTLIGPNNFTYSAERKRFVKYWYDISVERGTRSATCVEPKSPPVGGRHRTWCLAFTCPQLLAGAYGCGKGQACFSRSFPLLL